MIRSPEMILVTGGAGFIGSHSVDALLAAGLHVRVLDNLSTGAISNLPINDHLEFIEGDIRDLACVTKALRGATHVLHLAAQTYVQRSIERPLESAAINLTGFLNVIHGAREAGIRRFVYASSAAVYGQPQELPLREGSPTYPESPYGLEKLVNDRYAALFRRLYGMSTLGMRYFNVFGPRQRGDSPYSGVLSKFIGCLKEGHPLTVYGDGEQTRDFIHVHNIAEMNHRALFSAHDGVLNIATGETTSLNGVIDVLGTLSQAPIQVEFRAPVSGDIRHSAADNQHMLDTLGDIHFCPLTDGLAELLASQR